MTNISIRYQIVQKVRSWRLKQKYTLKNLADKAGINYHTLIRYEQGTCGIPTERLKVIADALSISIKNLFPRQKVLKENSCFDKAKTREMYNFIEKYKKMGGHKAIYMLTKSVRAEEESNIKAARIRIARNLVKAEFDTDIIYRATGLSTEEYADRESIGCTSQNGGQEIKKWRIIRGYTQEELAKKLDVGPSQIHHYEQGSVTLLSERLWEIANVMRSNSNSLNKYGYVSDANGLSHQEMGMYDDLGRYEVADEDMMYQKNYGIIGDSLKKITNLTGDTAKSIADYLIKPVSDQVAKQIVVPLGTEIISKIVVPITKKVAEQNQDMIKELTDKLMVRVEDFARLQIEKLKEDVKQEITSIPGKVLEKIKPSSWLPWKAESLDEAYSDTYVPNDIDEFAW